jgi:tetratricopeptide (TPR) repeat protein
MGGVSNHVFLAIFSPMTTLFARLTRPTWVNRWVTIAVGLAAISSVLFFSTAQAQDVCAKAWDDAASKTQEAEAMFKAGKYSEAEEAFKVATGRWIIAGQQCKDKNSETAKANAEAARESANIAKKNSANQVCINGEQAASSKFKEAIALFEKKDWQAAADAFASVSTMFNKVAIDCPGPIADVAKQNAEVVLRNQAAALTNLKNTRLASTTAVVGSQCEADVASANKLGEAFAASEKSRDFPSMSKVSDELDIVYKKIRNECAANDKAKVEFDERIKALADVKKQIPPCNEAYKAVTATRQQLKNYASQASSAGFSDTVRKFRNDVRKAQNTCFGTIYDANDPGNDNEADLLDDERGCLPALRPIVAKSTGAPTSANCKSKLFIEVEKSAKPQ